MKSKLISLFCASSLLVATVGCGPAGEKGDAPGQGQVSASGTPNLTAPPEVMPKVTTPNIVKNSSLETDDKGWYGDAIKRISGPANAHTGNFGLLVDGDPYKWGGARYGAVGDHECDETTVPIDASKDYVVSVWVKGVENYDEVRVQLQAIGSNQAVFGASKGKMPLSNQWQQVVHRFRPKEDTKFVGFDIIKVNDDKPAKFVIDDLELHAVPKNR